MAKGSEIRALIDTENVRGLLVLNGAAAIAALALLPGMIDKPGSEALARAIVAALLIYQFGVLFAVAHNRLRRISSLTYELYHDQPPPCTLFGVELAEPCASVKSILCMWLSVTAFAVAGIIVFIGGLQSLEGAARLHDRPGASAQHRRK